MYLTDDLYHNIIQTESKDAKVLKIISGYGSALFLKRVKEEYLHLKIVLFLGMTAEGVSQKNHDIFKELMNRYNDVYVYYQIEGSPNHMKILEFDSFEYQNTYIGSANFTENGFINNREVMTLVNESVELLFLKQLETSLLCIDDNIEKYIKIYEEEPMSTLAILEEDEENYSTVSNINNKENKQENKNLDKNYYSRFIELKKEMNPIYYLEFDIEIILEPENNPRWQSTGINSWINDKLPILVQTPRILFDKIFPIEEIFEIYSDDGMRYIAQLTGRFNGELKIINGNIYEYVKERIGLVEYRPISREDLKKYGETKIHFERIDKLKYLMSFNSKSLLD